MRDMYDMSDKVQNRGDILSRVSGLDAWQGKMRDGLRAKPPLPEFVVFTIAFLISLPALRAEAAPDPQLIGLGPAIRPLSKAVHENVRDCDRLAGRSHFGDRG